MCFCLFTARYGHLEKGCNMGKLQKLYNFGCLKKVTYRENKDKNVHRFAIKAIRGELFGEKEREIVKKRYEKEIVLGYNTRVTYYP